MVKPFFSENACFFLLFSGIKVNFVNKVIQSNCLCVFVPDERKNSLILTVAKKRMAVLVYRSALTWLATLSSPSLGKNGWREYAPGHPNLYY